MMKSQFSAKRKMAEKTRKTGKKIKDNYEKQKMQRSIQKLEEKHELKQKETREQPDFRFSVKSRNYKQNLENLFKHLNLLEEITSKEIRRWKTAY